MSEPVDTKGILARAVDATPTWVWAFGGLQIVTVVCFVAALQLSGLAGPLQRVLNAQAQRVEMAATNIDKSADRIMLALDDHDRRIGDLEGRVEEIETIHERNGVQ